jgi:ribosomal protein S18 acetylase RimI-like enzyme
MSNGIVTLREAGPDDEDFLREVYGSTRAEELAMTGWNPEQQDAFIRMQLAAQLRHYQAYYPQGEHQIILVDGLPAGRIYTAEKEDEIRILDVTILPRHRSSGLGTPLIVQVQERARGLGKAVRIYVDSNSRALRLFDRLGFAKVEDDGINALMEWRHTP